MKVRAIRQGFYGLKRRQVGEVFTLVPYEGKEVVYKEDQNGSLLYDRAGNRVVDKVETKEFSPEEQFSESWMEKVEDDAPSATFKPARVQQAPDARDVHAAIDEALGEDSVQAQGAVPGQSSIGAAAPKKKSQKQQEQEVI